MTGRLALVLALASPLAMVACAPVPTLVDTAESSATFAPLQVPATIFADERAAMAHFLATAGRQSPSRREASDYPGTAGDRLLLFSAEGLEDDAIEAQQWRVVVSRAGQGLRVTSAGVRQKCWRSGSNQWTTAPCP